jgi:XTP/dITP diphosphohydrolase
VRIVAATTNRGKAQEMAAILSREPVLAGLELVTLDEAGAANFHCDETAETFSGNAEDKARYAAELTGLPAIADDSGLCIDALGGAPGVRSARWLGTYAGDADRNAAILRALDGVPEARRTAQFVCAIALAIPGGKSVVAEGTCSGVIASKSMGTHGFGYDPIFLVPRFGLTMAELTASDKNEISHRRAALAAIVNSMAALLREMAVHSAKHNHSES